MKRAKIGADTGVLEAYVPQDRRRALAQGLTLPDRTRGAALYADISGSVAFTEALVRELGARRGVEALTYHLNRVYDALIGEVDRMGGSVIGFSGDAVTCWLGGDTGERAVTCAFAMQQAVAGLAAVETPGGAVSLGVKVAVASGTARRFLVGDPNVQVIDVVAGETLVRLAAAEKQATRAEVVLDEATVTLLGDKVEVSAWRTNPETKERFALIAQARDLLPLPTPAPSLKSATSLSESELRPWLLPSVYERLRTGQGEFLTELRPTVALFLRFSGLDYDHDEAAGEKLDAYIRWVQRVVADYGGTLIQLTVGDKGSYLYAAFGAPTAHEDDARRAVAVAQTLRSPPEALSFISSVQIGVGQGTMRTGAYGSATRRTYGVLGDGTNLAARLMQHALPGQVLISSFVRKAVKKRFDWKALPAVRVKGKQEPVPVFSLEPETLTRNVKLQEPAYMLPMVGREKELGLVEEKLNLALQGQGQIVGITAEAGMGKSRLIAEIIRLASSMGLQGYGGECQSTGGNTPYLVWNPIWRGLFGLEPGTPLEQQLRTLETKLTAIDPSFVNRLPLLDTLLNLSIPDNDLTRSFSPELRKASLEALLTDSLKALVKDTGPLLLVLEDIHWIDPLSHDLLEAIGRVIPTLSVLIAVAYRPLQMARLQAPRVTTLPHFSQVKLSDFTPQEAQRLIQAKLSQFSEDDTEVPTALTEQLTARAQGNPFYLEELINYLHDQGINPHDPQALTQIELPASLHSLILSRIDQLSERQKVTLKVASVIGRLFRLSWLCGYYPALGEPAEVKADLELLSGLDLTPLDTPLPELTYLFKHIVTREVAYESLAYSTRANLHEQFAHYLETQLSDELEQHLDLLAHHYARSENAEKNKHYLKRAAEASNAVYANEAALDYFEQLLPLQIEPEERAEILFKLAEIQQRIGQWEAAEARYRNVIALAETRDERWAGIARARAHFELGNLFRGRGDLQDALKWLTEAQELWERLGEAPDIQEGLIIAMGSRARTLMYSGDVEGVKDLLERALVLARKLRNKRALAEVLTWMGSELSLQSDYKTTKKRLEESLALAREVGDISLIITNIGMLGFISSFIMDSSEVEALQREGLELAKETGGKSDIADMLHYLGITLSVQKRDAEAMALYQESLVLYRELGAKLNIGMALSNMGYQATILGNYTYAQTLLDEGLALSYELNEAERLGVTLGNVGILNYLQGRAEAAKKCFVECLTLGFKFGNKRDLGNSLGCLAAVIVEEGRDKAEQAVRLAAAGETQLQAIGITEREPLEDDLLKRTVATARAALGEARFAEVWAEGQAMTLEEAVAYALEEADKEQEDAVSGPDFEGAKAYALNRLERELPDYLLYHSLIHTRDDVVPAVERIAEKEGVTGEALTLLLTAAYFHDIGFTEGPTDHEETGVRIASEVLPRFGYAPEQIETVSAIIMATKLPQGPRTRLEEILADADLDVLGRDDFLTRNKLLRDELAALGKPTTDAAWYSGQLRLLKTHRYFTAAARSLRGMKKQENLEAVAQLLAEGRTV